MLTSHSMQAILETIYDFHIDTIEKLGLSGNDFGSSNSALLGKIVGSASNLQELQIAR